MKTKIVSIVFFGLLLSSVSSAQLTLSPPDTIHLQAVGDTIVVPLHLLNEEAKEIDAFGLTLTYPTQLLTFLKTDSLGTLTEEWFVVSARENEPGRITVGGFHVEPITGSGVLLNVLFRGLVSGAYCDTVKLNNFTDDITDALSDYGLVTPVELLSFVAVVYNNSVRLMWQTASETNNLGFDIERKGKNGRFSSIGFVAGAGTTMDAQRYTFVDKNVTPGEYAYRLKQIDTDGSIHLSESLAVSVAPPQSFVLQPNFPNPFNPSTTIRYSLPKPSFVRIDIFNVRGQLVSTLVNKTVAAGDYSIPWSGTDPFGNPVSAGIYICRMSTGDGNVQYIKMVLAQ